MAHPSDDQYTEASNLLWRVLGTPPFPPLVEEVATLIARRDELLAANTAEVEHRRAAEAQADRMRPIVQQVGEAWLGASRDVTASDDRVFVTALEYGAGRAAAALVREREENEETARWGHETMPLSPAPVEPQP